MFRNELDPGAWSMQSEFISVSSEPVGGEGAVEEKNPKAILYDNISRRQS